MTTPTPLDPDQVACRKCGSPPAQPCRQPSGQLARTVHVERRRTAAAGGDTVPDAKRQRTPKGKANNPAGPPPEARAKGGKASAQARARRKRELAAQVEQRRADAEAAALEAEAARLADDAARFARDRAMLRRSTLDAARRATDRLLESLEGMQRAITDADGRIETTPVERWDEKAARQVTREVPDVRGWATADTIEKLAKVAASTLNSLRLEEGKPTGIERHETAGVEAQLGEAGVDELIEWAARNLPPGT